MASKVKCYFFEPDDKGGLIKPPIIRALQIKDSCVTTTIHGSECRFFAVPGSKYLAFAVSRPEPVTADAKPGQLTPQQLRALLDESILKELMRATCKSFQPKSRTLKWLVNRIAFWKDRGHDEFWNDPGNWTDGSKHFKGWVGDQIADYLQQYGIEDGEYIVISKRMLENIRQGGHDGRNNTRTVP